MISQSNFTSNFQETVYNKVKEIVGTTYTLSGVGTLTITFNSAYPADMKTVVGNGQWYSQKELISPYYLHEGLTVFEIATSKT
jgi:hypothetical protein